MAHSDVLVILPTLGDRPVTLRQTLESVAEQRKQVDLTLVLVAPESAIEARAVGLEFGAVLVDDPRAGISEAINRGIAARTTETYYAWIGDDDLYRSGGLAKLRGLLTTHSDAVLSYGGCDYIDAEGRTITTSNAAWLAKFLLPWGPDLIPHPGAMIKLDALQAIGGFDRSLRYAMDLDALLKLRSHGRFVWTRESVSAFRWHSESLTVANRSASSAEAESVKHRHLPAVLRPISPLWHVPIRWASSFAAARVSATARDIAARGKALL